MTVKEVFDLRKQGKIEEAYETIRPMYAVHQPRCACSGQRATWRRFVLMLNAAAVMAPDEHRYERFVKLMNYLLKEQKRQMHHIRKKHPRKRETKN